ncbi:S8 family peptidase [Candidatus Woesearchaeota archaeon]|nr:S8 family peptidase [Candidatus Woesearchaeota archaeon]
MILALPFVLAEPADKVRVFIEFKGPVDLSNAKVIHDFDLLKNVMVIEVSEAALEGIARNPNVVRIEPDAEVTIMGKPDKCTPWPECNADPTPDPEPTPAQQLPWGVDRIDAELASVTGAGVDVCIIDTGVDQDHADLAANIKAGINYVPTGKVIDLSKWNDDNGHGTHVAGTIAALNNDIGVVGVAPDANLLIVKALNRKGSGYMSDVAAGMDWCVAHGAKVISMSLGSATDVSYVHDAADAAYAAGALLVAAAGNEYPAPVIYPAAYDSVIAVAATDNTDAHAYFSNAGPEVELAAPGVSILSTWNDGGYNTISGTSMATPHVAGVAALLYQANATIPNTAVRQMLDDSAEDLGDAGRDNLFGFGLVSAGWI